MMRKARFSYRLALLVFAKFGYVLVTAMLAVLVLDKPSVKFVGVTFFFFGGFSYDFYTQRHG
jgi:hypothetical protein